MKGLYATKKLQNHNLYKELKDNLQKYYQLSLQKESKQKNYLASKPIINLSTGEVFKIDYEFEKEHTKYYKVIEQKIATIEHIAKSLGYTSVFMTFTLPSKFHPFKSIQKGNNRLCVGVNDNFDFSTLSEAIEEGYQHLNHIVRTFYKRVKNYVGGEYLYIKVFEAHTTTIPHCHYLIFFRPEHFKDVKKTFNKVALDFKLLQTDFETARFRDGINHSTRYIMKYLTKDLKNGSDYFLIRSLDGWKRQHKIRVITTSQLSLSMYLYKKIYYSLPVEIKECIERTIKEQKIPYYLYFQRNSYIKKRLTKIEKNETTSKSSYIGDSEAEFEITIKSNRIRAPDNKPIYKITFLEIKHLEAIIYRSNNYLIIENGE